MAKKTASRRAMSESARSLVEAAVKSPQDRSDDPLFVPHLEAFEFAREAAGDDDRDAYERILESICGAVDDSQPVEQYDGTLGITAAFVANHQAAACQVQWNNNLATIYTNPGNVSGVRWGSGTMISPNILLTCGHLFDQTGGGWQRPRQNGTTNIISPQEIARNMRVNFNFQVDPAGNLRPEQSFAILDLLEYRLGGLDMAICRVDGTPGTTFGQAIVSTTDAAAPDMICIIGHPAGQPKRVEAGPTTSITGNQIHYNDIDTLGGNSGSGILRASDGRIVGVHTNGGCTAASPAGGGTNFGQRIAAVIAASPTLQGLTAPKRKIADDPIATLKFRDDPVGTLKFLDDPINTLKFRDDPIGTLKFRDDPVGTLKFIDDPVGTLKFRDDVKSPALDKRPGSEGKTPAFDKGGFDGPGPIPSPTPPRPQGARPFILATPHHSGEWSQAAGEGQGSIEELESTLSQIHQTMTDGEAELARLDEVYRELLAMYESATGKPATG